MNIHESPPPPTFMIIWRKGGLLSPTCLSAGVSDCCAHGIGISWWVGVRPARSMTEVNPTDTSSDDIRGSGLQGVLSHQQTHQVMTSGPVGCKVYSHTNRHIKWLPSGAVGCKVYSHTNRHIKWWHQGQWAARCTLTPTDTSGDDISSTGVQGVLSHQQTHQVMTSGAVGCKVYSHTNRHIKWWHQGQWAARCTLTPTDTSSDDIRGSGLQGVLSHQQTHQVMTSGAVGCKVYSHTNRHIKWWHHGQWAARCTLTPTDTSSDDIRGSGLQGVLSHQQTHQVMTSGAVGCKVYSHTNRHIKWWHQGQWAARCTLTPTDTSSDDIRGSGLQGVISHQQTHQVMTSGAVGCKVYSHTNRHIKWWHHGQWAARCTLTPTDTSSDDIRGSGLQGVLSHQQTHQVMTSGAVGCKVYSHTNRHIKWWHQGQWAARCTLTPTDTSSDDIMGSGLHGVLSHQQTHQVMTSGAVGCKVYSHTNRHIKWWHQGQWAARCTLTPTDTSSDDIRGSGLQGVLSHQQTHQVMTSGAVGCKVYSHTNRHIKWWHQGQWAARCTLTPTDTSSDDIRGSGLQGVLSHQQTHQVMTSGAVGCKVYSHTNRHIKWWHQGQWAARCTLTPTDTSSDDIRGSGLQGVLSHQQTHQVLTSGAVGCKVHSHTNRHIKCWHQGQWAARCTLTPTDTSSDDIRGSGLQGVLSHQQTHQVMTSGAVGCKVYSHTNRHIKWWHQGQWAARCTLTPTDTSSDDIRGSGLQGVLSHQQTHQVMTSGAVGCKVYSHTNRHIKCWHQGQWGARYTLTPTDTSSADIRGSGVQGTLSHQQTHQVLTSGAVGCKVYSHTNRHIKCWHQGQWGARYTLTPTDTSSADIRGSGLQGVLSHQQTHQVMTSGAVGCKVYSHTNRHIKWWHQGQWAARCTLTPTDTSSDDIRGSGLQGVLSHQQTHQVMTSGAVGCKVYSHTNRHIKWWHQGQCKVYSHTNRHIKWWHQGQWAARCTLTPTDTSSDDIRGSARCTLTPTDTSSDDIRGSGLQGVLSQATVPCLNSYKKTVHLLRTGYCPAVFTCSQWANKEKNILNLILYNNLICWNYLFSRNIWLLKVTCIHSHSQLQTDQSTS